MNNNDQNVAQQMAKQINWLEEKFRLPKDQWFLVMQQKQDKEQKLYEKILNRKMC